jgi:ubiquinone/menaquinone biosynthesis C-methylase UbiE
MYDKRLSEEWIAWVESPNPQGTREREIFPYITKWLHKHTPASVVDIGCGQGDCARLVTTSYVGIDPTEVLLDRARELYDEKTKRFIVGDAYVIPLETGATEAVLSLWVWSHLQNIDDAGVEMHRILKPNGVFLIITANPESYEERKTFYDKYTIEGNLLRGTFNLGDGRRLTDTSLYLHSKEQLLTAVRNANLSIDSVQELGNGLYLAIEGTKLA